MKEALALRFVLRHSFIVFLELHLESADGTLALVIVHRSFMQPRDMNATSWSRPRRGATFPIGLLRAATATESGSTYVRTESQNKDNITIKLAIEAIILARVVYRPKATVLKHFKHFK
jgi:hypothetical protein